jgi:thymidylate kinase
LALALNGDREASIAALQRYANAGAYPFTDWQLYFDVEPAIAAMRGDPRFQELLRKAQEHLAAERRRARPDARRRAGSRPEQRARPPTNRADDDH